MTARSSSGSLPSAVERLLRHRELIVAFTGQEPRIRAVDGRHRISPRRPRSGVATVGEVSRASPEARGVGCHAVLLLEDPARGVEGAAVSIDELLEQNADDAESSRLRRRRPLSPNVPPVVQEGFVDHHREVGGEAALSLEFADDGVVVVAELEPDVGREIFGVVMSTPFRRQTDRAI